MTALLVLYAMWTAVNMYVSYINLDTARRNTFNTAKLLWILNNLTNPEDM